MTWIIAGLGNPGDEYQYTRHNTGRIIGEYLHEAFDGEPWKNDKRTNSLMAKGSHKKDSLVFVFPETYMNKSGGALAPLVTSPKKAEQLIVIYDDIDLPFGTFRISFNRGSGGHRGLESIIRSLKTEKFVRVRVGISPVTPAGKIKKPIGPEKVEKHILGKFKDDELKALKKMSKTIAEAVMMLMTESREKAMSTFNAAK
jgi:peptidyl-tRNA hydrolase, PTH1 family